VFELLKLEARSVGVIALRMPVRRIAVSRHRVERNGSGMAPPGGSAARGHRSKRMGALRQCSTGQALMTIQAEKNATSANEKARKHDT
jgi:hypothetical protein